ncbi:High-affinity glucose transporter [Penicillium riverlandense]|uniref:High-affinity glucose transporter n=1 Tax=Penicillium riverlandense TaxID=1903569 RepID=UPI002546619F|nr:High-affinity glucose transporter [Penicillium riverlandense]KAJ5815622.1 High-affinity glucose transporter [Penicillium riverlandense]
MGYTIGNIYVITTVAVVGGALFGFDIASMSAILGTQQYKCFFNQTGITKGQCGGPTSANQGGISAAMPGGSFLGALVSGILTDWIGRKRSIQAGSIIWCIGSAIVCSSMNIGQLVAGRFINGVSVGILSAQVPVYVAELAQPSKRGTVVGAQQWAITWGILIMFYVSYGCSFLAGNAAWRTPWGLQMIPAVMLFCAVFFLPESPRWLAKQDRWEEAHEVLALVHSKGDKNAPFVQTELSEIREMVEFERANSNVSYLDLFKGDMIFRTHVGMFTQIWSQLTGMNVMMLYITYVFGMAGLKGNANLVASSIQYVINVVMTIFALVFIDRWGRRTPLLVGSTLMMTFMFANAGMMASYGKPAPAGGVGGTPEESWDMSKAPHAAKGIIACTYLFVASYAPTWGPVSWIYPPELFPLRLRGKAVAVSTASNWIFNFALSYFVPPAFENIQWKTYIVFGVFCFAMTVHVFFLFPETAGKTLEEVETMFTTPGLRAWKTEVQFQHVRKLEQGAITSDKLGLAEEAHEPVAADTKDVAAEPEKETATATQVE